MDTGLLYRAVALNLWRWGGDPANEFEALRACDELGFDPADEELRSEPVSRIASQISAYSSVRDALLQRQRDFAAQAGGAVLDGRDIGTVIAPNADVKLFVTAIAGGEGAAARSRAVGARNARPLRGCPSRHTRARRARHEPRDRASSAGRRCRFCWTPASWISRKPSSRLFASFRSARRHSEAPPFAIHRRLVCGCLLIRVIKLEFTKA